MNYRHRNDVRVPAGSRSDLSTSHPTTAKSQQQQRSPKNCHLLQERNCPSPITIIDHVLFEPKSKLANRRPSSGAPDSAVTPPPSKQRSDSRPGGAELEHVGVEIQQSVPIISCITTLYGKCCRQWPSNLKGSPNNRKRRPYQAGDVLEQLAVIPDGKTAKKVQKVSELTK